MDGRAVDGATASTEARLGGRSVAHTRIAQTSPEDSVVARLAHLQCAVGNAAVVRLLGDGGDEAASRAPDPAP